MIFSRDKCSRAQLLFWSHHLFSNPDTHSTSRGEADLCSSMPEILKWPDMGITAATETSEPLHHAHVHRPAQQTGLSLQQSDSPWGPIAPPAPLPRNLLGHWPFQHHSQPQSSFFCSNLSLNTNSRHGTVNGESVRKVRQESEWRGIEKNHRANGG